MKTCKNITKPLNGTNNTNSTNDTTDGTNSTNTTEIDCDEQIFCDLFIYDPFYGMDVKMNSKHFYFYKAK
jgi:hypothetical protein